MNGFEWLRSLFRHSGDGSAHVAPTIGVSIILSVCAVVVTAFAYAWLISHFQSELKAGLEKSPVVRNILNESLGQPLQPAKGTAVDADSESGVAEISPRYLDAHAVSPAAWLEVLKRLGIADADGTIQDYYGSWAADPGRSAQGADNGGGSDAQTAQAQSATARPVSSDNLPVAMLIADLLKASRGLTLAEIKPFPLVTRLALQIGGRDSDGVAYSGDCWSAALSQVMADYPDRWPALAQALRQLPGADKAGSACPWTNGGLLASQPGYFRYTYHWLTGTPSGADVVRALFSGAGALNASKWPDELRPKATEDRDRGVEMQRWDGPKREDVKWLSSGHMREAAVAEQFARQVLAAAMTTADVARPKLWVDMLMGLPQFILNLFFVLLLAFIGARWLLFWKTRREIGNAKVWLDSGDVVQALQETDPSKRANSAGSIAETLRSLQVKGGPIPVALSAPPKDKKGNASEKATSLGIWWHSVLENFRPNSLALLMAEKATTRLIIGEPQPELFREFCVARRAVVDESAWFLRYLARALPALGFVGTILGILFALNGADGIVRATTQAERVAAMAAVTGPLAFAFSHTLMALIFGLVTGFFIDRLTAKERIELLAYEESLIEKIDPAERMPLYESAPRSSKRDLSDAAVPLGVTGGE